MTRPIELAIIGGSGFYEPGMLSNVREVTVTTPYGDINPLIGDLGGREVAFLARHGKGHSLLPHQINYQANLWGLKSLGISRIVATAAVGSLRRRLVPGSLVVVDQFIDFTKRRPLTFFEHNEVHKAHVDVTGPYCLDLQEYFKKAAEKCNVKIRVGGCYICTEGPRYETAAEIKMFRMLGGDVIGMTGVPEVVLARELGICYANISLVTNQAAGIGRKTLVHAEVVRIMKENQEKLRRLITECLLPITDQFNCKCGEH